MDSLVDNLVDNLVDQPDQPWQRRLTEHLGNHLVYCLEFIGSTLFLLFTNQGVDVVNNVTH